MITEKGKDGRCENLLAMSPFGECRRSLFMDWRPPSVNSGNEEAVG
jgi:hypothetical protein